MHRRTFLTAFAVVPFVAASRARVATATLYVPLPDDVLLARADVVAMTRVAAIAPEWSGGRILSRIALVADETYKGTHSPSFDLLVPGGTVDGVAMRVAGYPTFVLATRAILLVAHVRGVNRLVGAAAGKLDVVRDARGADVIRLPPSTTQAATVVPFEDFRRSLREAIARVGRAQR